MHEVGRRSIVLGMASVGMANSAAPVLAEGRPMSISFAPASAGIPGGFSVARTGKGAPAVWSAIADTSVPGGYVLAQTSTDQTDYRFPLAIYDPLTAFNLDATVRFKALAGRVDRAGGLAIRLADADNYYVVRANALEDNVNLYRVVLGSRHEIKGAAINVTADTWHTLGLSADGDKLTISFDGQALFTVIDRTFTAGGKVALWTKADSVTHFNQLVVTPRS
jgi:hypothetical protein